MKTKKSINILKIVTIIFLFPFGLAITSCSNSDDGDDDANAICDQLVQLTENYTEAFSDFQANTSESTCNQLRSSAIDLIDALNDCSVTNQFDELAEAAQMWTDLDCTQDFD